MSNQVYLYVDGSCRGNPGPGGYAAILQYGRHERGIVSGEDRTTNNRMELSAVIAGLRALKRRCQVVVVTDSQYVTTVMKACSGRPNLLEQGRGRGQIRANPDLVQELYHLAYQHEVEVVKVNGHSGHAMNECADRLAYAEATNRLCEMGVANG